MSDDSGAERSVDHASGTFRSVVTYLEMLERPAQPPPAPPRQGVRVERWERPDLAAYLALFHRVGDPWLWYGRLTWPRAEIERLIQSPDYAVWRLWADDDVVGLCEFDQARSGEVKIEYFGLVPEWIGAGLGGYFLRTMVHRAWGPGVRRVWLHTCTEDHPSALEVYQRAGFQPYDRRVEWIPDPRLNGLLPPEAGPHVPLAR